MINAEQLISRKTRLLAVAVMLALVVIATPAAQAQTFTTLYNFSGFPDGAAPEGDVVMDNAGNLYGTTTYGGASNSGTVWELSSTGTETVLHSFGTSGDGANPRAGVLQDASSNLYGTTVNGGQFNEGTVYKVDSTGQETVLYSFGALSGDGLSPYSGLIFDNHGYIFGTTRAGGNSQACGGCGTVFSLDPTTGKEAVVFNFDGKHGSEPDYGSLLLLKDCKKGLEDFYGTTRLGGPKAGVAFVIHVKMVNGQFIVTFLRVLYESKMSGGLSGNGSGNLYGTSYDGGKFGAGAVVKLDFKKKTATDLYSFTGSTDGANPNGGVIRDANGNLYGTTEGGGDFGYGTVFKVSSSGKETVLHSFDLSDGSDPVGGHLLDSAGTLYGVTTSGGLNNAGTVFSIKP